MYYPHSEDLVVTPNAPYPVPIPQYSPKGALSYLGHLLVLRKLVAERKLHSVVVFGHDGGLPVRPTGDGITPIKGLEIHSESLTIWSQVTINNNGVVFIKND